MQLIIKDNVITEDGLYLEKSHQYPWGEKKVYNTSTEEFTLSN